MSLFLDRVIFWAAVAALIFSAYQFVLASHGPDQPKTTLSERINAVCPKGFQPTDWEIDGEFTNIPPETVKVTCTAVDFTHVPSVAYRSVAR